VNRSTVNVHPSMAVLDVIFYYSAKDKEYPNWWWSGL